MSKIEDIEIISRVLAGDIDSYSYIIEKYQNMIFRYAYMKFNDYDEAQDITQDVFIIVLEALKSFRQESKFSTWLYSIMVNYCKNYRKKKIRNKFQSINIFKDGEDFELQLPDEREDPEGEVVRNDTLDLVKEEINRLPDDYREIILLRDIEGVSYNDISEILEIKLSNVKVRIHRGRELLKNRLYARGLI